MEVCEVTLQASLPVNRPHGPAHMMTHLPSGPGQAGELAQRCPPIPAAPPSLLQPWWS